MAENITLVNGRVFTGIAGELWSDSVQVADGRVVEVGEAVDGNGSRVLDVDGALVTPGFIDAHVHPATTGLDKLRCSFDGCVDRSSAIAAVQTYAQTHPREPWILGAGWSMGWFEGGCPRKEWLDEIVPNRPVLVSNADGHGAWVNSRALEMAGIDAMTPDPLDGRIERLPDGSPQGTLHEGAVTLVERHAPANTADDYLAGLEIGQAELHSHGVTGWQDAIVDPDIQEAYSRLDASGRLTGRVVGAMWWDRNRGLEQVSELVERRSAKGRNFAPTSVKLMLDGVAENYTASILDPWLDAGGLPTDNRGVDFIDPSDLMEIVVRLDELGFQCHFHAIGDGAVRNALDAVEAARQANPDLDLRHHIAHLQFIHPDDLHRFAALGVVANAQPYWACVDEYQLELTQPFISPERHRWQYPFGSLHRAGARIAMGSDWGVSTSNVMAEIAVAVTRSRDGGSPLYLEEALTPVEALLAFTSGSAYINHADSEQGAIAAGMLADLVVFDRDPFEDGLFQEARVMMTFVGGDLVYEAI
ncbi:MAG: amidohydrolase [Acidimicrobiia bacterium]